jgi:hypothetical protein
MRLGDLIESRFVSHGLPSALYITSAFASLPTVLRFKQRVIEIRDAGGEVRIVLGVDLGGTSKEVLAEVASWRVTTMVVKNRMPGIVFHPKVYVLRWQELGEIIVGSNNLTDGGMYKNYEASILTSFEFPKDLGAYEQATGELRRFLAPTGPTASELTPEYLDWLTSLPEIPSEAQARKTRGEATPKRPAPGTERRFGFELVAAAPRLPPELQQLLLQARQGQDARYRREVRAARRSARSAPPGVPAAPMPEKEALPAQLDPAAFYMTLAASRGATNPTIPGEQRIPLEARDMAEDFWGWPDNYLRCVNPRLGARATVQRVYHNWYAPWRVWSTDDRTSVSTTDVRLYFYENSSDFRFYAGPLIQLAAEADDIVRIRRIDEADAVFECVLARKGTTEHAAWERFLVNTVRSGNSTRRFGFE